MMANKSHRPAGVRVPDDLESSSAKLVYLYLEVTQGATLGDLRDGLDLTRLTLCAILSTLQERGLVDRDGEFYAPA